MMNSLRGNEKQFTALEASEQLFHFTNIPFKLTISVVVIHKIIHSINVERVIFVYIEDDFICEERK